MLSIFLPSQATACIRLARAVGLLSKEIENGFRNFANVRNEFAHISGPKKITASHVKKLTGKNHELLKITGEYSEAIGKISTREVNQKMRLHTSDRKRFTWWAMCANGFLMHRAEEVTTP